MKAYTKLLAILFSLTLTTNFAIAADDEKVKILVLGDSLSAAYGIPRDRGWVNLLASKLSNKANVINTSISGETTDGGLAALPRHLKIHVPDIVILELGANDGLRGFPIPLIKKNLQQLINISRTNGAQVILVGIHIPPNYGQRYTEAFYQNYVELSQTNNLSFVPFLLDGVVLNPELMQDDGLHPTAQAQPKLLANVLPYVEDLLSAALKRAKIE